VPSAATTTNGATLRKEAGDTALLTMTVSRNPLGRESNLMKNLIIRTVEDQSHIQGFSAELNGSFLPNSFLLTSTLILS
jgi:hypothetical protein